MDGVDRKILYHLQNDADLTIKEIAQKVHLSPTPCWKRIQRLEDAGVIRARVALLDPAKVGAGVTVFIAVRTDQHNIEWSEKFAREMKSIPEVMEIYRMSGTVDYLLRVVVPDIAAFDRIYKTIIGRVSLTDVTSMFAMEQMKYTTALPV
ncbi:MAG: Lrp/AsnC family transcriptional regulator [Gammaproteobacteria bacterium]|nr:Lrp/AsnC family transcriptional regulator [Gammaproteobacteria bacterium]MDA7961710.1 Lrp/AsnC family transcriptional regulator [Gammaproteobacteria bacterium]MDA7969250.1 Lrp/AsnC family transcriptional regulator [Gammaproteobacteria bacterium]MDA7971183.1 Lrp/AsnC family transcriptional regulator [Gammaproteobacteria bacterium]MDA7994767.1 Lrp/AsnC family transcriptional regulator [Gammaproteobacteria bacterium]